MELSSQCIDTGSIFAFIVCMGLVWGNINYIRYWSIFTRFIFILFENLYYRKLRKQVSKLLGCYNNNLNKPCPFH
jgi:hypothetical protein